MKVRLTENQFRNLLKRIAKRAINETTLDYDEDNFSGNYSRGTRYDIYVDGTCMYEDVSEEEVDRLADDVERRFGNVEVKERGGDYDEDFDDEDYEDDESEDDDYDI